MGRSLLLGKRGGGEVVGSTFYTARVGMRGDGGRILCISVLGYKLYLGASIRLLLLL